MFKHQNGYRNLILLLVPNAIDLIKCPNPEENFFYFCVCASEKVQTLQASTKKKRFQSLTTQYSKSELVSRVSFDRNISPNSKGRSPIFLLGWPALGDCSICDIIPSNLSSGSFFYLPIWQAAVFEVGCHTMACPSSQVIF